MNTTVQDCVDYRGCYPSKEYLEKNVGILGKEIKEELKELRKRIKADTQRIKEHYKELHKNTNKLMQSSDNEKYKNKYGTPLCKVNAELSKLSSYFNGWR